MGRAAKLWPRVGLLPFSMKFGCVLTDRVFAKTPLQTPLPTAHEEAYDQNQGMYLGPQPVGYASASPTRSERYCFYSSAGSSSASVSFFWRRFLVTGASARRKTATTSSIGTT